MYIHYIHAVWTLSVRPDLAIFWTLGNFLKPLAAINLPKSPTFLGKFSSEIIFGQLLYIIGDFLLVTLDAMYVFRKILKNYSMLTNASEMGE